MPDYEDGKAALVAFQGYAQNEIDTTHEDALEPYHGADVIIEDNEAKRAQQIGRPYYLLSVESDEKSEWSSARGEMRKLTAIVEVHATDFSGAVGGTVANPEGSDTLLSRILVQIVDSGFTELCDTLGLIGAEIRALREETRQEAKAKIEHLNPHRFICHYQISRS